MQTGWLEGGKGKIPRLELVLLPRLQAEQVREKTEGGLPWGTWAGSSSGFYSTRQKSGGFLEFGAEAGSSDCLKTPLCTEKAPYKHSALSSRDFCQDSLLETGVIEDCNSQQPLSYFFFLWQLKGK